MGTRELVTALVMAVCGCLSPASLSRAEDLKPCSESTELECIHSARCTLVQAQEHGKYICRAAVGRCEIGFRQAGDGDIQKDCESKAGCEFKGANCYCPPNLNCTCGGGPPAQCVERGKSK